MRSPVACLVILVLALVFGQPALADLGIGFDVGGGPSLLNNYRLHTEQNDEQRLFSHTTGMGYVAGPRLFVGWLWQDYFAGAELEYIWADAELEYDYLGGVEDFEAVRRSNIFRVGGVFQYFILSGKIKPYVLAGASYFIHETRVHKQGECGTPMIRFDSGMGTGVSTGFGVDFTVADKTTVGGGIRIDGNYFYARKYADRLIDQGYQLPVTLYFRTSFDLKN